MRRGWTLYKYEHRWHELTFTGASLSDRDLTVELETGEDRVTVTACSQDGLRYEGDYRYRDGSYSNGDVTFERFRSPAGDVLVGEWRESSAVRGEWILKLDPDG
ncbi:hypothetical protein [Nitrospira sp. Kam-Ns4a]